MLLSLRRKVTIISLLVYWVGIFVLAHIPIPEVVYKAQVSDKSLHVLAYLILAFLLWFSVSPDNKVILRKAAVWWVLFAVVLYGGVDELLQGHTGRSCDVMDFFADVAGAVWGLILFIFLTFWPALLAVTAISIFFLTNLAKADVAKLVPAANVLFHMFAYGLLALVWTRNMALWFRMKTPQARWLATAIVLPTVFLLAVKVSSSLLGKTVLAGDLILSVTGVAGAVVGVLAVELYKKRRLERQTEKKGCCFTGKT